MKKAPFKRGLDGNACEKVGEFLRTSLGTAVLDSTCAEFLRYGLYIRKGYVDFYWRGCRALSLKPQRKKNCYKINQAYMEGATAEKTKRKDVALVERDGDLYYKENSFRERMIVNPDETFAHWQRRASEGEKYATCGYCNLNPHLIVLDVEVARRGSGQVDLALIQPNSNMLTFVEVKLERDSRQRSVEIAMPGVVEQMVRYRDFLIDQEKEIENSYRVVVRNLIELGLAGRFVRDAANPMEANNRLSSLTESLKIDPTPQLLIFPKAMPGRNDVHHRDRLRNLLVKEGLSEPTYWKPIDA